MPKTCKNIIVSTLCLLMATLLFTGTAFANAQQEAEQTLQHAVDEITLTLNNANLNNLREDSTVISQLETLVLGIFSMDQFSMRTVGKKWKTFTPAQKTEFKDAFVKLLKATYFKQVSSYNGQALAILGSRTNKKGTKVEVRTSIKFKNEDVPVNYRMLRENGKWMVYDVLVEGVSLVKNYRTQFKELLRNGTPDELIAKLQQKAVLIRQQQAEEAADKQ